MKNNKLLLKMRVIIVCVVMGLLLGCVSNNTVNKVSKEKVIDRGKALELHVQMALGYIDKGSRESARHHLVKAFEINKESATATGAMAMLYQLEGEPTLAEEQFKLALKRDKNFTLGHNNYGVFLYNQKRYELALEEFEKAAADLAYSGRSQALTNVGKASLKLGNMTRAKAAFEHAGILDRSNAEAFIELADINFQKQEYSEAKKYLDQYESVGQRSPRSILLAIRLERVFGNKDKEATLANSLKANFPYSKEYLEYKQNLVY
ncbi:MAG: type IV pilus biogenesis/stability protein PilW [Moraxellaceae bacterium]|nr:MAG: type IV pilus biogenesis/stability protein PilW [Moraxellaceae bacterium]